VKLLPLLDELRAMAQTGLQFADDPYDHQRYERMLELVAEYYGETFDLPPAEVRNRLAGELGEVSPKVASLVGVVDDDGRLLVIKRADDGRWCLPGGKLDVGESPEEAAVREAREETGVRVAVEELVDTYAVEPPSSSPHHTVVLLYRCTAIGGEPTTTHEADAVRYLYPGDVPAWSGAEYHPEMAADVLAAENAG
jgi:8-oxo-dGTP pyrophosphatase MutT (NUDIX family)